MGHQDERIYINSLQYDRRPSDGAKSVILKRSEKNVCSVALLEIFLIHQHAEVELVSCTRVPFLSYFEIIFVIFLRFLKGI